MEKEIKPAGEITVSCVEVAEGNTMVAIFPDGQDKEAIILDPNTATQLGIEIIRRAAIADYVKAQKAN